MREPDRETYGASVENAAVVTSERRRSGPRCKRWLARTALVLGAVVVLLGAYVTVVVVRSHTPRSLAQTAVGWPVGRMQLEVGVPAADRIAGPGTDSVWLWYPSVPNQGLPRAPYAPGQWDAMHLPGPVGGLETDFSDLRIRARTDSRPATGRFALVVLQPGLGFSAPQYQALAEDLAAAGFVVAGVTPTGSANTTVVGGHVYGSSPQGNLRDTDTDHGTGFDKADRLVDKWSGAAVAVAATIRQNKIIADHVKPGTVYVGHSFGGAASLQACHDDPGCLGAVDLDGAQYGDVVQTGLDRPLMLISSAVSCITGSCPAGAQENPDDRQAARSLLEHSRGPGWCQSIAATKHFNFSDYGDYYIAWPLRKLLALGSADGDQATRTIDRSVIAFARHVTTARSGPMPSVVRSCS